jgi:hypothetical protein
MTIFKSVGVIYYFKKCQPKDCSFFIQLEGMRYYGYVRNGNGYFCFHLNYYQYLAFFWINYLKVENEDSLTLRKDQNLDQHLASDKRNIYSKKHLTSN